MIIQIVRDPAARVAAIQARAADIAVQLPIREADRLSGIAELVARIDPQTEICLLQIPNSGAMQDRNLRLALHHAHQQGGDLARAVCGPRGAAVRASDARNARIYSRLCLPVSDRLWGTARRASLLHWPELTPGQ